MAPNDPKQSEWYIPQSWNTLLRWAFAGMFMTLLVAVPTGFYASTQQHERVMSAVQVQCLNDSERDPDKVRSAVARRRCLTLKLE